MTVRKLIARHPSDARIAPLTPRARTLAGCFAARLRGGGANQKPTADQLPHLDKLLLAIASEPILERADAPAEDPGGYSGERGRGKAQRRGGAGGLAYGMISG